MKFYIDKDSKSILTIFAGDVEDFTNLKLLPDGNGATEKHVPVVKVNGNIVEVALGEVAHPMTDEHLFSFVCLETDNGLQIRNLTSCDEPKCIFNVSEGKPKAVYAYCNLHGLWKIEI